MGSDKCVLMVGVVVAMLLLGVYLAYTKNRSKKFYTPSTKTDKMYGQRQNANRLMPMDKPRGQMPQRFGADKVDPKGFLGSYVPSDTYVQGCHASGCAAPARPLQAACNNQAQAMGPCAAGYGLDSSQLFPTSLDPCDGFDQVLVSAPLDFLYADNLMDDVNVLTTTRLQTRDLRGEPAVAGLMSKNESGDMEMGPFGGAYQSSVGAYELRAPVRSYLI